MDPKTHTLSNGDQIVLPDDPTQAAQLVNQIEAKLSAGAKFGATQSDQPPGQPPPAAPDQPQSFGHSVVERLRGMGRAVLDPANRASVGGALGAAMTGPLMPAALAAAPETFGTSLLIPAAGALIGGMAGRASADLGTSGKVNPSGMIDSGIRQGVTQAAFGDIPAGAMRESIVPALKGLGIMGNFNALLPNVTKSTLNTLENPATGRTFPAQSDALRQIARDELENGYGRVGSAGAANAAQGAKETAQTQIDAILARAPKDKQGRLLIGMLPKADTDTLALLQKDLGNAEVQRGALSNATRQPYMASEMTRHNDILSRLAKMVQPGAVIGQAAWGMSQSPMLRQGSPQTLPNLLRLSGLLSDDGGR